MSLAPAVPASTDEVTDEVLGLRRTQNRKVGTARLGPVDGADRGRMSRLPSVATSVVSPTLARAIELMPLPSADSAIPVSSPDVGSSPVPNDTPTFASLIVELIVEDASASVADWLFSSVSPRDLPTLPVAAPSRLSSERESSSAPSTPSATRLVGAIDVAEATSSVLALLPTARRQGVAVAADRHVGRIAVPLDIDGHVAARAVGQNAARQGLAGWPERRVQRVGRGNLHQLRARVRVAVALRVLLSPATLLWVVLPPVLPAVSSKRPSVRLAETTALAIAASPCTVYGLTELQVARAVESPSASETLDASVGSTPPPVSAFPFRKVVIRGVACRLGGHVVARQRKGRAGQRIRGRVRCRQ